MKYFDIIILAAALNQASAAISDPFVPPVPGPGETCILKQTCKDRGFLRPMRFFTCRSDGQPPTPSDIENPSIEYFKPDSIKKDD
jgi:hypothetical protein